MVRESTDNPPVTGGTSLPVFRGISFSSTLEADWACTFDALGWEWRYRPEAIRLSTGEAYRPAFHLPAQRVWCEVLQPVRPGAHLPAQLQRDLAAAQPVESAWQAPLVVVLRAPFQDDAAWWDEDTVTGQSIVVVRCPDCRHHGFMDFAGVWSCRRHFSAGPVPRLFWLEPGGEILWPGDVRFHRLADVAEGAA